jgi:hypothetical protein
MILALKPGVKLTDLQPQMVLGAVIVAGVYEAHGAQQCVLTSVNDSKHGLDSLHYKGRAGDFRTKDFSGNKLALRDAVREALGPDFDVVLEHVGEEQEHIHVEWDPK